MSVMNFKSIAAEVAIAAKSNPEARVYIEVHHKVSRVAFNPAYPSGYRGYHDQLAVGDQSVTRDAITVSEFHTLLKKLAKKKAVVHKKGGEYHVDVDWSNIWFANDTDETTEMAVSRTHMFINGEVFMLYTESAEY